MMKRARIAVDYCGETPRMIWPLKAGEVLVLTQIGLIFFTTSMKYEFQGF